MFESFISMRNDTDRNRTDSHVNIHSNITFSKTWGSYLKDNIIAYYILKTSH